MTTNRLRTLLVVASMFFLGTRVDMPVANGTPPGAEDRIDELERQVTVLRRELTDFRRMVVDERLMDRLHGSWTEVSHRRRGRRVVEDQVVEWRLKPEMAKRIIHLPEPEVWELGSMTFDATKSPIWVDFAIRERRVVRVLPGIVKLERNLELGKSPVQVYIAIREDARCTPSETDDHDARPISFESTEENGVSVYVLRRDP